MIDVLAPGIVMVEDTKKHGLNDAQVYLVHHEGQVEVKIGANLTDAPAGPNVTLRDLRLAVAALE